MPRHINPVEPERTATAPYNFVPLPNKILTVDEGVDVNGKKEKLWEMHGQYVPGTHSGWIDLNLKTLTPLFIRGPITKIGEEWDKRDSRLRAEPFTNKDGVPVIPGSSLRGMIRSLVEVLSFSKINPVTDERPFFRTVAKGRIGDAYRNRINCKGNKTLGGYARKINNQWSIVPAQEVLKIHKEELKIYDFDLPEKPSQKYYPKWDAHREQCWFKRDEVKKWLVKQLSLEDKNGWEKGVLVLTGSAPKKEFEFLFVGESRENSVVIPDKIFRRFHDNDQLTQWQEKAFPKDKPFHACRKSAGYIRDGEPVFYLVDDGKKDKENPAGLVFFGRAQMFRFPYDLSPLDLILAGSKQVGLDLSESIFGMVQEGKLHDQSFCIKGRVFFEDATAKKDNHDYFEPVIIPRILSSPKITCFQHYLTQDGLKNNKKLTTYLRGDYTTIRGVKKYWHRWDSSVGLGAVKEDKNFGELLNYAELFKDLHKTAVDKIKDKQHTVIRPVKPHVVFHGRIRFSNLSDVELGALLAALNLPDGCAHKLGMGKPLGLGSIKIKTKLSLFESTVRYGAWGNDGVSNADADNFIGAFEKLVIDHALVSDETIIESKLGLSKIGRLQALYTLLDWENKLPIEETEYMALETFRELRVLPSPHKVAKHEEPDWKSDPPYPG